VKQLAASCGKNQNVPPPAGLAAASILRNQTAVFGGNNDLSEITHQPVHFLALALIAIFDLIRFYTHTIKFSQISTEQ
jgi:hypothetical protein